MIATFALLAAFSASAANPIPQEPSLEQFEALIASLDFHTGSVSVADGAATIELPEGWSLLHSSDARKVVEGLWGNPKDPSTLAFIDPPSELGPLGSGFGIIVSMDETGFVEDSEAKDIDYGDLLKSMQEGARSDSEQLEKEGHSSVELLGWAEPPHYDASEKKLYWAKELRFGGQEETTLNYDVRILSRRGYLQLQAVASMQDLSLVDQGMKALLPAVQFNEGYRYGDFDKSSGDKIAAYGIGGLIAGKAALKLGFFAVIAKFGKFIILGVVGLFVAARKFLFGGSNDEMELEREADGAESE